MTFANCPKCGSSNVTTAGVCANCGWTRFPQVTMVSTRITGETEIKVTGKALLDDYKRLLLENNSLTVRIAELEAEVTKCHELQDSYCDRIAELESAQRWIPVDEKPLEAGVYFVRLKNGVTKIDWTFIDGGIYYWWNSGQDSVTHYMPLPQPPIVYRKEREE